jgi:hypothetical protein
VEALFHVSAYIVPLVDATKAAPAQPVLAFVVQFVALAIIWTWLYRVSNGSLLLTSLFHGTFDVFGNLFLLALDPELGPWLWSASAMVWATVTVLVAGPSLGRRDARPAPGSIPETAVAASAAGAINSTGVAR